MAASNYATGELLDRFQLSPRIVTVGIGLFFFIPGVLWLLTRRWWDDGRDEQTVDEIESDSPEVKAQGAAVTTRRPPPLKR
jgi:hypothetical protein